ncbi:hypothetical protein [Nocardia caishijiensis]|uniref:Lon proteolytic domain-containing protein n=1 Tax=Nocardia caishijiensis TaxID=184756 RepID=A0ABQ6YNC1_9NOCA|nr:hypothetical protein [Nocardia caishijiensis]KAF0847070.1 hypothetical protein FNL39_104492 [Nocardia caishijiensis]
MLGLSTDTVGLPGSSNTAYGPTATSDDLSGLRDHVVLDMLVGAEQRWLRCCRSAVAAGADAARALFAPRRETEVLARASLARWKSLDEDELLVEEAESPEGDDRRDTAELSAARALGALACALAGVSDAGPAVVRFLAHAERAGLGSAGSRSGGDDALFDTGDAELASVLDELSAHRDHPARDFALLTALELAGRRPTTTRTSEVRVLFVDAYGEGHVAVLRLTQVENGPSGLHPDPARMSFLQADADFRGALADAWDVSGLTGTGVSVLWSLTLEGGAPANDISGASSGAAFAVALAYLLRRGRVIRRRIDPSCAITAGLVGDRLTAVGGYRGKLRAAQRNSLRVIVAAESLDDALDAAPPQFTGRITAARSLDEAIRDARIRLDYLVWTAVAALTIAALLID